MKQYFFIDCKTEGAGVQHKTKVEQSNKGIGEKLRAGYISGYKDGSEAIYYIPRNLYLMTENPLTGEAGVCFDGDTRSYPCAPKSEHILFNCGEAAIKANPSEVLESLNSINHAEYTRKLNSELLKKESKVGKQIEESLRVTSVESKKPSEATKKRVTLDKPELTEKESKILPPFKDGRPIEYATSILPDTSYVESKKQVISVLKVQRNHFMNSYNEAAKSIKEKDEQIAELRKEARKKDAELEHLRSQAELNASLLSSVRTSNENYKSTNQLIVDRNTRLKQQLDEAKDELGKREEVIENLINKRAAMNREIEDLRKSLMESSSEVTKHKTHNANLQKSKDDSDKKIEELQRKIEELEKKLNAKKPKKEKVKRDGPGRPPQPKKEEKQPKKKYIRQSSITDKDKNVIIRLYEQGEPIQRIVDVTSYSRTTIFKIIRESGIDRRGKGKHSHRTY